MLEIWGIDGSKEAFGLLGWWRNAVCGPCRYAVNAEGLNPVYDSYTDEEEDAKCLWRLPLLESLWILLFWNRILVEGGEVDITPLITVSFIVISWLTWNQHGGGGHTGRWALLA